MPTHKISNDFIRKWNKTLAIKGYSKMSVKDKTALIEKRLKEVKLVMVKDMRKEWTEITSKYSTKIKSNETKRAQTKKKTEPKKEKPAKTSQAVIRNPPYGMTKVPVDMLKRNIASSMAKGKFKVNKKDQPKKTEPKKKPEKKVSGWNEFKDILDKNESKLKKMATHIKGKDVNNLYDYYKLFYVNRDKLNPAIYLKSIKEDIKKKTPEKKVKVKVKKEESGIPKTDEKKIKSIKEKKTEPKKISKDLKESIQDGAELEREGLPGLESSQFREQTCRHILTLSRGLIEAQKKGFPKIIDSNKEKFVWRGMGSPDNIALKNPKIKKTSLGLTGESSVPVSQLEQIITYFQNFFYTYRNQETPAKVRAFILRGCGATEAQVYDKAEEIMKKDYPTIIKKINSFKSKKRIELEALPENKLSKYDKELQTVIPNFLKGNDEVSTMSSQIVPVKEKSEPKKEKPKKEEKKEDERSKLIDEIIKKGDIEIEIDDMPSDGSPQMRTGFGENGIENVIKNWSSTIRMNKNTKQKIRNIIINEIKRRETSELRKISLGNSIIINFGYNDTQGITYGNELIITMSKKELIFYLGRAKQILKEMLDTGENTKDEVTEFTKLYNERIKELRSKK